MDQSAGSRDDAGESLRAHLRKPDHWTFLLALAAVVANVFVVSRSLSALAAVLLLIALGYDAWEFNRDGENEQ